VTSPLTGGPIAIYTFLMWGCGEGGADLLSLVTSDSTQVTGTKRVRGSSDWTWGKGFSPRGWWVTGTGSPGKRLRHPVDQFKRRLDDALGHTV